MEEAMELVTNTLALKILKAISIDETHSRKLTWSELTEDMDLPSGSNTVKNISKRNSYWPDMVDGKPYNWNSHYRECFERYVQARGNSSTIDAISRKLEAESMAGAPNERLTALLNEAEKAAATPAGEKIQPELLTILDYIIEMAVGGKAALRQTGRSKAGNAARIGFVDAYWNPTETQYWKKISEARRCIDIIHFHGLSWTNTNREFLVRQLANPSLRIRVALLDPASPFFAPYAEFIGLEPSVLESKFNEVVGIWRLMLEEAANSGELAKFTLCKYRGFPAKSIYRFDDTLVITPTTNARPKSQFVAILAKKMKGDADPCAFRAYMQEVEWAMESGATVLSS